MWKSNCNSDSTCWVFRLCSFWKLCPCWELMANYNSWWGFWDVWKSNACLFVPGDFFGKQDDHFRRIESQLVSDFRHLASCIRLVPQVTVARSSQVFFKGSKGLLKSSEEDCRWRVLLGTQFLSTLRNNGSFHSFGWCLSSKLLQKVWLSSFLLSGYSLHCQSFEVLDDRFCINVRALYQRWNCTVVWAVIYFGHMFVRFSIY